MEWKKLENNNWEIKIDNNILIINLDEENNEKLYSWKIQIFKRSTRTMLKLL